MPNKPHRPNAKLDEEAVRSIRESTEMNKVLAARHGVNPSTISHVRRGKTWK